MAQRQRQRGSRRTPAHARHKDNEGIVPVLARAVRELESAVQRGPLAPGQRVRFQVVALLVREHRTDVKASTELSDAQKDYAASDVRYLHGLKEKLDERLEREGRMRLAQACFDFLPHRALLDLAGWPEVDIFAHV